jgi:hypothetical protein
MTGNTWICLTLADYENTVPVEVASYYEVAETTTWQQINEQKLSQRFKMQRGPYTVSGIQVMFVNMDVDYTTAMATALQALQTTVPFGFMLTEAQVRGYMQQQWYTGTLSKVVAYSNKVATSEGYTGGTNKYADPVENDSTPGQWAILKHPSYQDASMTLIEGELPQGWLPEPELP